MNIALAQINTIVGDFDANINKIIEMAQKAYENKADLLLTPELALSGYPPEDLLLRPAFFIQVKQSLKKLAQLLEAFSGLAVLVGHPWREGELDQPINKMSAPTNIFNAATLIVSGQIQDTFYKIYLPNTEVFDEHRYFVSGQHPFIFTLKGVRLAIVICEDIWHPEVIKAIARQGADLVCVLNASPFFVGKLECREQIVIEQAKQQTLPIIYLNMLGGQDEIVFDGGSFAVDRQGKICMRLAQFEETDGMIEFQSGNFVTQAMSEVLSPEAQIYQALVMAMRDYVQKNGFPGALIGLSGGIDSALVLAIAYDALGKDRVKAVMMPSEFTADMSISDARQMAQNLGIAYSELAISSLFAEFNYLLRDEFKGQSADTTEENIQARIRGTLLMALSNKFGQVVLTTGNKSEMAVGYCTLYGDMAGGFAVLKDVLKTWVYRLANYRNHHHAFAKQHIIPQRIIDRPPSAELRANQTDQDSLPDYETLDAIIQMYVEDDEIMENIIQKGFDEVLVKHVLKLIRVNEYKRKQSPIGPKVTKRAFGRDWRYPITSHFKE